MLSTTFLALSWASTILAHAGHEQKPVSGPHQSLWYQTIPGDGGTQASRPSAQAIGYLDDSQTYSLTGRLGFLWYLNVWTFAI